MRRIVDGDGAHMGSNVDCDAVTCVLSGDARHCAQMIHAGLSDFLRRDC